MHRSLRPMASTWPAARKYSSARSNHDNASGTLPRRPITNPEVVPGACRPKVLAQLAQETFRPAKVVLGPPKIVPVIANQSPIRIEACLPLPVAMPPEYRQGESEALQSLVESALLHVHRGALGAESGQSQPMERGLGTLRLPFGCGPLSAQGQGADQADPGLGCGGDQAGRLRRLHRPPEMPS